MRERKSGTIFLTGGTGFLGSHLAVHLLCRGYRVVMLARKSNHMGAEERVIQLLSWFAISPNRGWKLEVIEGDIEKPDLGLGRETHDRLARSIDEIIHAASNTSFAERKRHQVESSNITGLRNVLELARQSKCGFFHYISTAYVAGELSGLCKEEQVSRIDSRMCTKRQSTGAREWLRKFAPRRASGTQCIGRRLSTAIRKPAGAYVSTPCIIL